jgi:hypothetical protein
MRLRAIAALALVGALFATSAVAAIYKGRRVDGRWFQGRVVNTTYGAYDCEARFDGERVLLRLPSAGGLQINGFLEDEVIHDPRDISVEDPRRGVYWTLTVFNLGS